MEKMFLFGNIIDLFILYLYQLKNTLNILVALLKSIRGNLVECQKTILKIQQNQAAILHQFLLIIMYYTT